MAALTALAAASVDRLELARRASVDADCTTREFDGATFDLPAAIDVFTKCKLLVVRRAFSPEVFGDVRREFERFMRGQLSGRVAATGTTTDGERFYQHPIGAEGADDRREVLLPPSFARAELVDHPLLQPLLSDGAVLGPALALHTLGAAVSRSGSETQHWHTDDPYVLDDAVTQKGASADEAFGLAGHDLPGAYAVTMLAPLSNLTARHGPTQFCVGSSHLSGARRPLTFKRRCPESHRRTPLLQPGDLLLFDYQLMHRGGPNDSGETRALLYLTFGRRWFKDHNALSAFDPARSTFGRWWEAERPQEDDGRAAMAKASAEARAGLRSAAARGGAGGVRAWWAAQEERELAALAALDRAPATAAEESLHAALRAFEARAGGVGRRVARLAFPARLALPGAPPRPDAVDDDSVPLEQLAFAPLTTLALADVALGAVALLLFVAALAAGVWCLADDDTPGDKARKWA